MGFLLKLLILVVLIGVAVQQGWVDAALRSWEGFVASPSAEAAGSAASTGVAHAMEILRNLPEPWATIALLLGGAVALVLLLSIVAAIVVGVMRIVGWLRDILV